MDQGQFETLLAMALAYIEKVGSVGPSGTALMLDRALAIAREARMKEAEATIARLRGAYKPPPRKPMDVYSS
jgi:hypothetical protein